MDGNRSFKLKMAMYTTVGWDSIFATNKNSSTVGSGRAEEPLEQKISIRSQLTFQFAYVWVLLLNHMHVGIPFDVPSVPHLCDKVRQDNGRRGPQPQLLIGVID